MKILIVYAHPEPTSFNHALKEIAIETFKKNHHEVQLSDLYAMHFNAVADWSDFTQMDSSLPRQYSVIQRDAYLKDKLAFDIKQEQEKLSGCDLIIFQFPL
jgi:NAD(P)H dehydrogenase (quinone)